MNGLMSCAPNLEMLIGKPVTGKRSEAAKDSATFNPQMLWEKKHMFFHDVFLLLIPNQANTLFWTFLLMSILSYIGALFGWQPQWGFGFSHSFGGYNLMKVGTTQDGSM